MYSREEIQIHDLARLNLNIVIIRGSDVAHLTLPPSPIVVNTRAHIRDQPLLHRLSVVGFGGTLREKVELKLELADIYP
jgi:hypothetical protein